MSAKDLIERVVAGEDASNVINEVFGRGISLTLMQFPSKKWGFVGTVPAALSWERIDGKPLSDEDVKDMVQASNPAMVAKIRGIKSLVFKTPEAARKAAKKGGFKITQDMSKGE